MSVFSNCSTKIQGEMKHNPLAQMVQPCKRPLTHTDRGLDRRGGMDIGFLSHTEYYSITTMERLYLTKEVLPQYDISHILMHMTHLRIPGPLLFKE